jgi:PKD repeat protein
VIKVSLGKIRTFIGSNFAHGACLGKDSKTDDFSRIITLVVCSFLLAIAFPLNVMADVSGSISTNSENYVVGDIITITVEFFDENGDATDPNYFEVNIIITSTDSLETRITKSAFSRAGVGFYQKTLKAQEPAGLRSASVFPCNTILGFCQPLDDTSYRIEDVPPPNFTLTVKKSGNGSGTVTGQGVNCGPTCSAAYKSGILVTLTPTPAQGSTFGGWSGCDSVSGNKCSVKMNSNRTITANFNRTLQTFTLTVTKQGNGSGTVTGNGITCGADCSESYQKGTSVMLTATSMSGSTFGSWSGCDSVSGSTCTVAVNSNRTVTVSFSSQQLPDLVISKAKCGISFRTISTLLCVVTIDNTGVASADSSFVSITAGEDWVAWQVDGLQPGQSTRVTLDWEDYCNQVGNNVASLIIAVDYKNQVKEIEEGNNSFSTDIDKCANLPELQGRILTFSPENPEDGETVIFTVTIRNLGSKPAGSFKVNLRIGTEELSMQVNRLAVNEQTDVKFQWIAACGSFKALSIVDPGNRVKERNENNNESVTINVKVDCRETKFLANVTYDNRFIDAEVWEVQVTKVLEGVNVKGRIDVVIGGEIEECASGGGPSNVDDKLGAGTQVEIFGRAITDETVLLCSSLNYYLKILDNPNEPPVADFDFSPQKTLAGTQVKFTDKSMDPDGTIKSREWTFGDRAHSTSTQTNPSFSYNQAGSYGVCLNVRDNRTTQSENLGICKTVEVVDNGGVIKLRGTVTKKQTQFNFQLYWVKVDQILGYTDLIPEKGKEVFIRIVDLEQLGCVPQHTDLPPQNAKVEIRGEYIGIHDPKGNTVPGVEVCAKDYYLKNLSAQVDLAVFKEDINFHRVQVTPYAKSLTKSNELMVSARIKNLSNVAATKVKLRFLDKTSNLPIGENPIIIKRIEPKSQLYVETKWTLNAPLVNHEVQVEIVSADQMDPVKKNNTAKWAKPISVYFAKLPDKVFDFEIDTYSFANDTNLTAEAAFDKSVLDSWPVPKEIKDLVAAVVSASFDSPAGYCYGMASSSVIYWISPNLKPVNTTVYSLKRSQKKVIEKIKEYQKNLSVGTIAFLIQRLTGTNNPKDENSVILNSLRSQKPILLLMHGLNKDILNDEVDHAVVAYQIIDLGPQQKIYIYDNTLPYSESSGAAGAAYTVFDSSINSFSSPVYDNFQVENQLITAREYTHHYTEIHAEDPAPTLSDRINQILDDLFKVIQSPKSTSDETFSRAQHIPLSIRKLADQFVVHIDAIDVDLQNMKVAFFDLNGRMLLEFQTADPVLDLSLTNVKGMPFPSGIYVYVLQIIDKEGYAQSRFGKIVLFR